jgi:hypothetical protein
MDGRKMWWGLTRLTENHDRRSLFNELSKKAGAAHSKPSQTSI